MTLELWSGNIPADATDIVGERIARIVKRANKHGFPVPSLILGDPFFEVSPEDGQGIQMVPATIVADGALQLGEYTFIGTVAALGDGSAFITYAPGAPTFPGLDARLTVNHCDHCNTIRDRKDTYLVGKGTAISQVGSSCIKDFLGHDPAVIVGWLDAIEHLSISDDEIAGWSRSATRFYEVVDILDMAARIVAQRGYVSKQKAMDEDTSSTGELLRGWLSVRPAYRQKMEDAYPVTVESASLFNATIDAIRSSEGTNEWESDIVRLFGSGSVQWRHVGILGSAVILGLRTQERKTVEVRGESNFIGSVGDRLEFSDVRVILKRGYEGQFGQSFVIRMSVNESDDLLWFASWSETTNALNEGDILTLVGTVKGHELDKRSERPTTVLTRCVIKERVPAAA